VSSVPTGLFFDALAVRLDGKKAEGADTVINFVFTDIGETHVIELENAVLHHRQAEPRPDADTTVKLTREGWNQIITGQASFQGKILSGEIDVDGSRLKLLGFFAMLDDFEPTFNIVTP
jgi:alkyl sulfatase BDS1-like metallo-beta-lactamase superfamily hydrolase